MLLVAASSIVQANANKMFKKNFCLCLAVTEFLRNMNLINVVPADIFADLYKKHDQMFLR